MNNKDRFITLLKENVKRDGISKLIQFLDTKTDFFTAPASTRYHHSEEGGLVAHSLEVFDWLWKDYKGMYPLETVVIVALLHDVCKANYYKVDYRNAKNEQGQWEKVPYYTVEDKLPYGHGEKSVYMVREFINLSLEEAMAIRWHMGAYEGQSVWSTLGKAYEEFNLAMYLHFSDMKSNYVKKV